jgi:hypothetical protein
VDQGDGDSGGKEKTAVSVYAQRHLPNWQRDEPVRHLSDDQATLQGGWAAPFHLPPHVQTYRHHNVFAVRGTLERAQTVANHESPRTTKLYDHTREELSLEEMEKIRI